MSYKKKAEEVLKRVDGVSAWDVIVTSAIAYALLYIGDVLNKHLSAIAKDTKVLKAIARRMPK